MIKHMRIDERLIHGQVASVWTNFLGCSRIIVANDEAPKSEMQIAALKLACPTGVKLSILSVDKAAANILSGKYDEDKVFLITRNVPDAKRLVDAGAKLAEAIPTPCDQSGSWFMGYYAQALLDLGRRDEAMGILAGLKASMQAAKNASAKVGILVNVLPLVEKAEGPKAALDLADEGVGLCDQAGDAGASQMRDYLESQRKVLRVELSDDPAGIARVAGGIAGSDRYPMRIRVEFAWREASAQYKLGDLAEEKRALEFVARNGGKLALAQKAAERLAKLA